MPMYPQNLQSNSTVFVSYSRADAEIARSIYNGLEQLGFKMWRDRSNMIGGEDWWQQIEDAIRNSDSMVLCLSPEALLSPIVAKEWRYARQVGTRVLPVIVRPINFNEVPQWMAKVDWFDLRTDAPERELTWGRLVNQLNAPYQRVRTPFTAPDVQQHYVQRDALSDQIKNQFLEDQPKHKVIFLQGGPGFGKTALAQAICHDIDLQTKFTDGILWLTIGENPSVPQLLTDQIELLSGKRPEFADISVTMSRFREILSNRQMLIVLDDVWQESHVSPFLEGGDSCVRLITTRRQDMLPLLDVVRIVVDRMTETEALELLIGWTKTTDIAHDKFVEFIDYVGRWALLLELSRSYLRMAVLVDGETLEQALQGLTIRLQKRGFTALDQPDENQRNRALSISLSLSIERLKQWRDCFFHLAIFPPDIEIPFSAIFHLWQQLADMDALACEDALKMMHRLSLLSDYNVSKTTIRLHDAIRDYLVRSREQEIVSWHQRFLDGFRIGKWSDISKEEIYLWNYLPYHLINAQQAEQLVELIFDFEWLQNKLDITNFEAVLTDFNYVKNAFHPIEIEISKSIGLLNDILRLIGVVVASGKWQLASHLYGNLLSVETKTKFLERLFISINNNKIYSWMKPFYPISVPVEDGLIQSIPGDMIPPVLFEFIDERYVLSCYTMMHKPGSKSIRAIVMLSDLVSSRTVWSFAWNNIIHKVISSPNRKFFVIASTNIEIFDARTSEHLTTVNLENDVISDVIFVANEIIIGFETGKIEVRTATGELRYVLDAHKNQINVLKALHKDQQFLSASLDGYVKVWDVTSGKEIYSLDSVSQSVILVEISSSENYILCFTEEYKVNCWNTETSTILYTIDVPILDYRDLNIRIFPDESLCVLAVDALYPDGTEEGLLLIWDLGSGEVRHRIPTNTALASVDILPHNQYVITSSAYSSTCIWDVQSGECIFELPNHNSWGFQKISEDYRYLFTHEITSFIKVWDIPKLVNRVSSDVVFPSNRQRRVTLLSPDRRHIYVLNQSGIIEAWTQEGQFERELVLQDFDFKWFNADSSKIDSSGQYLALVHYFEVSIWELDTGKKKAVLVDQRVPSGDQGVSDIEFSVDSRFVFTIERFTGYLTKWDILTAQRVAQLPLKSSLLQKLTATPDGKSILCLSHKARLLIIDTENVKIARSINCFKRGSELYTLNVSLDGKYILAMTYGVAKIIDFFSGQTVLAFNDVKEIKFCPDGINIVIAFEYGVIEIWDLEGRQQVVSFDTQLNHLGSVAINYDLTQLWTCNWEGGIMVWDLSDGNLIAQYWEEESVDSLDLSADGLTIVVRRNMFRLELVDTLN